MPASLTESPVVGPSITVPEDGDDADEASLLGAFQEITNRLRYLLERALGDGGLVWSGLLYCTGASNVLGIGPIHTLTLANKRFQNTVVATYAPTSPALAPSTHYYLYAANPAGSLTFEHDTVAPDGALWWKSTDSTRRYLGCFRTKADGNIAAFRARRGRYTVRRSAIAQADNAVTGLTATAWADASLATLVPPHARVVRLDARIGTSANPAHIELRTKGDTTSYAIYETIDVPSGQVTSRAVELETDAAQTLQYQVTAGDSLALELVGFDEDVL